MAIRNYMQNFDMNPLQTVSEMGQGFRRNQLMQQQIDQNQNAMQRTQDQDARDGSLGEAYAAGGNYDEYLKANPQDFERVQQLQQLKQQLTDKEFGKSAYKALLHLDSNNLSAMDAVIDQNAQMINKLGDDSTAETYKQLARDNPESLRRQLAGVMHMSGFEPMQQQGQVKQTPEIKNINEWKNMPTDTAAQRAEKDAFGLMIKATENPKQDVKGKNLFAIRKNDNGDTVKYFKDGSEEVVKPNQPVKANGMRKALSPNRARTILSKANEGSKKAAGFAVRLRDDIDSMNELIKNNKVDPARAAIISSALGDGTVSNLTLSPSEQVYLNNAKDALFAILRPETGAAITKEEQAEYAKIYLPQVGDSEEVTKSKSRKLENQFRSNRNNSGDVYDASVILNESYDNQGKEEKTVNWSDM